MQQPSTSALQEVAIPIDLGIGIDTKTDPKLVLKTRLLRLENAVINMAGQITKRPGTQSLPNVDTLGVSIAAGQSLGTLDNELLIIGQGNLYSFGAAQAANFQNKGPLTTVGVNRRIFASNLTNIQSVNAASVNGVTIYAYDSAVAGSVHWLVVDESSGTVYQSGSRGPPTATAQCPQFVVVGNTITLLMGTPSGAIVAYSFNTLTPWVAPTTASLSTITLSGTAVFGAATDGSATILVAGTNNAGSITVATYNATTLALIHSATTGVGFGAPFISVAYWSTATSGANWGIAYPNASAVGQLGVTFYSTDLTTTALAYVPILGSAANPIGPCCLRYLASDKIAIYATVFNPQTTSPLQNPCGQYVTAFAIRVSSGGSWTPLFTGNVMVQGAQLASFPWATGVGTTANILVQYQVDPSILWQNPTGTAPTQSAQPTTFIYDADTGVMVGRGPPGQAMVASLSNAGVASYPVLPAAKSLGSNRFLLGLGASLTLESQSSEYVFSQGVGELLLDYGLARAIFLEKLKSVAHVTGGQVDRYDGQTVAENGFSLNPEFMQATGYVPPSGSQDGSSLIDIQWTPPTASVPVGLTTVTFPPGANIYPGEWWAIDTLGYVLGNPGATLAPAPSTLYFYRVNGVGTAPSGFGATVHVPVDIKSTDTSLQVAQKTLATFSGVPAAAITYQNGVAVLEIQSGNLAYPSGGTGLQPIPSVQSGKFKVAETIPAINGGVSTTARAYSIIACAGAFISPSQYFQLNLGTVGGVGTVGLLCYVWFTVNGVGTDPKIKPILPGSTGFSNLTPPIGVEVDILSSDSATTVASKIWTQLTNAVTYPTVAAQLVNIPTTVGTTTIPQSQNSGPFIYLSLVTNSAAGQPDALIPEIGANVNVGDGALGLGSYNGAGGSVNQSAYGYAGVYAEVDARGNIHRSAPGEISVTVPRSPLRDARLSVTVPYYHLTNKGSNCIVEIYRTVSNGSTFYKITPSTTPLTNSATTLSATWTDTLQDARATGDTTSAMLTTNEILYTDGGNLQHDVMAPAAVAHVHRGRVWLGGFADDRLRIQASLLEPTGRGVAFSNDVSHTIELSPDGGDLVTFGTLDEKLILFKQRQIFWTAGDGPDSTGQNGSFLVPERIMSEVGCDAPKSVLEIPSGLIFSTEKGWFLLGRDLSLTHMEEADAYNNFPVTSGVVDDASEQCRWTTLNGPTICYNYMRNAWSINPNSGAVDSVVYAPQTPGQTQTAVYYYLTADGKVHREIAGLYTDDGVGYSFLMQTAWIKPGDQVAGFARARKALWLGLWPALQYSTLTIEYNYNEPNGPPATTETMNLTATGNGGFWGDGASWGADASWGGPALVGQDIYRWRAYVASQKGTAFRFTLQDIYPYVTNRAVQIANLTLFAAIKKGAAKLGPTTQSIG